jgi:diguanylate cyclase (GGDEF)-like protein/PAS domain S-box-containing protein
MEAQSQTTISRRRSDRVSIAFPLEASGIDPTGKQFCEKTKTSTVSRYGCCLSLPRLLRPEQEISLHRASTGEQVVGRVVAQMGSHAEGYLYGVGMHEPCESLWGISFSTSFHEELLDSMYDGVYFVNRDRKITYWNEGAARLAGYSASEAVGRHCFENFLGHVDETGKPLCLSGCPLSKAMADGEPKEAEFYLRHKNGHRVPISVRVLPVRNSAGAIVGAVEVFSDSTAKRRADKRTSELETLAFRDSLTGLPNRRYMELKVEQALQDHEQFGREYGLLLFDLDRFKQVNDSYGHDAGDALLKAVTETLVESLRPVDLVGRWGGEEFLILMADVNALGLGDLAERCRVLIAQSSVAHGASRVSATASIGATLLNHTDSAATAIRRADELMYQSKRSGGDRTTAAQGKPSLNGADWFIYLPNRPLDDFRNIALHQQPRDSASMR